VPLKFQRDGIAYDELSEEDDRDQWDEAEWDDENGIARSRRGRGGQQMALQRDTVDKVLEHLMTRGQTVAGGDRLGKTIIFAKNQAHAEFIAERFDKNYPHLQGEPSRASSLQDRVRPEPHRRLFPQREGPAHRHLGRHARHRHRRARGGEPRLLQARALQDEVLADGRPRHPAVPDSLARDKPQGIFLHLRPRVFQPELPVAGKLSRRVSAFSASRLRPSVESYAQPEAWAVLSTEAHSALAHHVAGLPSALDPEPEEAKRFDLLLLKLQLALLRAEPAYKRLRAQVQEIAGLLAEKSTIPMVYEQIDLIEALQSDEWWQDVTVAMLERVRRRLRTLIRLIEKAQRKPIYTDFVDEMGPETSFDLPAFTGDGGFEKFRAKVRTFLRAHQDHIAIHKLRMNHALTRHDLAELERILAESGAGSPAEIQRAASAAQGLGIFVRSLVGLERKAAKEAFAGFITGKALSSQQLEFIELIINHLTEHGIMDAGRLYESPFTDLTPHGPDGLFGVRELDALVEVLNHVRATAVAA
jgi:type I site-specific restriction endonuclease